MEINIAKRHINTLRAPLALYSDFNGNKPEQQKKKKFAALDFLLPSKWRRDLLRFKASDKWCWEERQRKNAPSGTKHDLEIPSQCSFSFFFVKALTSSIMFVFLKLFTSLRRRLVFESAEKKHKIEAVSFTRAKNNRWFWKRARLLAFATITISKRDVELTFKNVDEGIGGNRRKKVRQTLVCAAICFWVCWLHVCKWRWKSIVQVDSPISAVYANHATKREKWRWVGERKCCEQEVRVWPEPITNRLIDALQSPPPATPKNLSLVYKQRLIPHSWAAVAQQRSGLFIILMEFLRSELWSIAFKQNSCAARSFRWCVCWGESRILLQLRLKKRAKLQWITDRDKMNGVEQFCCVDVECFADPTDIVLI